MNQILLNNIIDYIFKCRDLEFEEPNYDMLINIINKKN